MNFKPGDRVKLLEGGGRGLVTSVDGDIVNVLVDDFEVPVAADDLVKIDEETERAMQREVESMPDGNKLFKEVPKREKARERPVEEVDLHIGALVDSYAGMANAEIIVIQLAHFRQELEAAVARRQQKIVFIHGVGEGVLRNEIRKALDEYGNISYHDASYRKYGFGATEVYIRYH